MELEDLIKKHGIEEISKKTKLTILNMKLLQEEDYKTLTKVRSIGFLSIIERVYKISLENYKKRVTEFFDQEINKTSEASSSNMIIDDSLNKNIFFKFKTYIILFILFIAIYILYINNNFSLLEGILNNNFNKTPNDLEIIMEDNNKNNILINKDNIEKEVIKEVVKEEKIEEIYKNITLTSIKNDNNITFININSKEFFNKKIEEMSEFIFDSNNANWIIKSETGYLKILYNDNTFESNSENQLFFYFNKNKFEEISQEEFNRMNEE